MSTRGFARRPRLAGPRMPGGEVELQAPPEVPRAVPGGLLMKLMPVVMVVAMLGMVALMFTSGGMRNPMMMLFPLMMLFSMVGMMGNAGGGKNKKPAELNEDRKDYFRYLAGVREDVQKTADEQRAALRWNHPDPCALTNLIGGRRMWERSPGDADFLHVRIGVGHQRLATKLAVPALGPLEDLEPISTVSMRRFVHTHSVVDNLPTALSLRGFAAITVGGDRAAARSMVRSIILQLCVFHGPDQVLIAVVTPEPDGADWSWTKWLPHNAHPTERDALGPARLSFRSLHDLEESLEVELLGRGRFSRTADPVPGRSHLIVVLDGGQVTGDERILAGAGMDGISVVDLTGDFEALAARRGMRLNVRDGRVGGHSSGGIENFGLADEMSVAGAVVAARMLAGYRVATRPSVKTEVGGDGRGLMGLLGVADPLTLTPVTAWRPRSARERLRVPIGVDASGAVVEVDLKEAAENGMGPHGLCIGATGSGKSELLRTLVLSLITSHSPDQLNLVLVDFKGGATFLGLEAADHVAAVITNLEEELGMVDRMHDALSGELNRRQELLRAAGNYANVNDYERARVNGSALEPLPALFIVVDEFSELLSQKPDFADLFTAIGRLGRSLHVHLLLASQRLDEGKLRGLDSHLSYRIGLKTFSGNESRSVLGVPDAYHLPNVPGSGYLKCDSGELVRFNASYVSGPVGRRACGASPVAAAVQILEFTAGSRHLPTPLVSQPVVDAESELATQAPRPEETLLEETLLEETLLDAVVGRLANSGYRAHEVWLPPLEHAPTVDQLARPVAERGALAAFVGVVDRPFEQRRDVLALDLAGAGGNVAIVGGPQSGKSTAARTLVLALASDYSPQEVQFYCLDFGGGTLAGLANLPHVGSVAGRLEADRVRRTIAELTMLVSEREIAFRDNKIESMRQFRDLRAAAAPEARGVTRMSLFGDVFLVVDGWNTIREDFEQLEPMISVLAARGLSYGVHVVLCANRWGEFRPALKDLLGTRIELRLGDPGDSEMDRRKAARVPVGRPGRGLTRDGKHLLMALPRADGVSTVTDLAEGMADAVARLSARWPALSAPPVRMLPVDIPRSEVLAAEVLDTRADRRKRHLIPIGIDEGSLAAVHLDFEIQPHFYAFADPESGKTTLLRNIVMGLIERNTIEQAKVLMVDYRRTMLGLMEGRHLAGYAATAKALEPMVAHLVQVLTERMPGPDVTQQQLRERSWWSGPEVYVVVDDYDLVSTATVNPLLPLVEFFSQAKDVGLHVILTRRSGGAARAMFDPVIGRLRELSADGLVMSGNKDEGPLIGSARPSKLPPGRGVLVSRSSGERLVQVANLPDL